MMDLKYYLRGLGIGVIVTALIMGLTVGRRKEALSNEEIKERARALGMVEESQLLSDILEVEDSQLEGENSSLPSEDALSGSVAGADLSDEEQPEPDEGEEPEQTPESPEDTDPEDLQDTGAESENESEADPVSGQEEQEEPPASEDEELPSGEIITIEVNSGEGSFIVCQKLEDAGLVPLASEFDRYLYENGYDKRINIGTYEIPVGANREEIAAIIARLN